MALATRYFGELADGFGLELEFPAGLPAFENETSFVLLSPPETSPIVFLQSARTPALCFFAIAANSLVDYELSLSPEALEVLGEETATGQEFLVLAILTLSGERATANLLAPLVIDMARHRGVQAVRSDLSYSHAHPVDLSGIRVTACS